MSKENLQDIIENFKPDKFINFFREKSRNFTPRRKILSEYEDDLFIEGESIGEIKFDNANMLFVCFQIKKDLAERSGKKRQYEKAREVLKKINYDSGIFIFYDKSGNFRFSLIYTNYTGKRDWSNYKRFTYYVSKERTNKTFKSRIGESKFDNYEAIKEAFSVDKVTKEFYTDIANWYFWAVDKVKFPKEAEEITDGRKIAVLRLITRLIFIWFMRELKLIREELFKEEFIKKNLKDVSEDESTYYKAILQNLFFATLSTPKEQRQFTDEERGYKGLNKDFGNHSVFRYQELFKNPEGLKILFGDIPYLNGGLFECLDKKEERIYIDGFSRTKKNQPTVPNYLFFAKEHKEDLNKWYGTEGKNYNIRGLLDILSSYNFTTDENSSDDSDVALDPELLGKVFENLLASFNPETSTTARKATGSFYTPREIVDYMVTESLKEYFKTHLTQIEDLNEKLESLFNKTNTENPFSQKESRTIVQLIENVRIVDPAVGSGAFPMGILNKLVFILNKVDHKNLFWKEAQLKSVESMTDATLRSQTKKQIEKYFKENNHDYGRKLYLIKKCIYGVDIQQIAVEIAKLRFFIALLVDADINEEKDNWGILPLPNLEFKIMQGNSLLEEFEGIRLDNLTEESETIYESEQGQMLLIGKEKNPQRSILFTEEERKTLTDKIADYYDPRPLIEKKELLKEIDIIIHTAIEDCINKEKEKIEKKIFNEKEILKRVNFKSSDSPDVVKKKKLSLEKQKNEIKQLEEKKKELEETGNKLNKIQSDDNHKPYFLWHLFCKEVFEKGGFDIVIGNPPYLREKGNINFFSDVNSSNFGKLWHQGKMDFWFYFLHKSIDVANASGIITFITSRYWLNSSGAEKLIQRVSQDLSFVSVVDIGKLKVFDNVVGHHMIAVYSKIKREEFLYKKIDINISEINKKKESDYLKIRTLNHSDVFENDNIIFSENIMAKDNNLLILGNIFDTSIGIQESPDKISKKLLLENPSAEIKVGDGVFVLTEQEVIKLKLSNYESNILKPYIDVSDVAKYFIDQKFKKFIIYSNNKNKLLIGDNKNYTKLKKHLDRFKNYITSSNKPYGLHRPRDEKYFTQPKIIFKGMFSEPEFVYDTKGYYMGFSFSSIIQKYKEYSLTYLLAILNSKFAKHWFYTRGKMRGAGVDIGVEKLRTFPIPNCNLKIVFEVIVDAINCVLNEKTSVKISNDADIILKIIYDLMDAMVYELYFPESIKASNAEIIDLTKKQIPDISNIDGKDKKLEMIEKAYKKLSDPENEINRRIERQNTLVEEVKIINESLAKKSI